MPDLDLTFQQETDQQSQPNNPFLNGVAEEDRPVVGKYIDDWDKGVQTAFEKIHQTYAPFKGMDAEQVERALYLTQLLDQDPNYFIDQVRSELGLDDNEESGEEAPGRPPEWEGVPEKFVTEFEQLKSIVSGLGEGYLTDKQQQQEDIEMAQLDDLLEEMQTVHGPFDEDWVTVKLAQGYSPEDALEAYDQFVESLVGSYKKPASSVPIMGGNGGVPSGQVDTSKMGRRDTQKLVAQILEASNQE